MKIHFWGVRGSIPSPLQADQVRAKVAAAVSRITYKDIESEEAKMRFLSSLPDWIYGTVGGNTPCVELKPHSGEKILIDCGTGLRSFTQSGVQPSDFHYHIFLSHFHWDHIQGFPFFGAIYNPNALIEIYCIHDDAELNFSSQNSVPFFPPNARWENLNAKFVFHKLNDGDKLKIGSVDIECHKMDHPGGSGAFSFVENGKKFIYCSDAEIRKENFDVDNEQNRFFENTDVLILDSQYTNPEAIRKINWGHNSYSVAIDFASRWKVRNLYFYHHEPAYDDKKLDSILAAAGNYKFYKSDNSVNLHISVEGQEVEI